VTGSGQAAADGGGAMDGVIGDARSGVAAIAPATGTPAGKQELVRHLQGQLDRARDLLKVSEQRNMELAALIERGSAGYNPAAAANPMGGVMGGGMPMGLGGGGGGLGWGFSIPGLDSLTGLTGNHHNERDNTAGLTLTDEPSGPDAGRVRAAIRKALDIEGIHDLAARARWEGGMMVVAKRESGFSNNAVNNRDSNAAAGDPTKGSFQFTAATFRGYHEPGTSDRRTDDVAEACAFINYARGRYHVAADGSNLATSIQQADPTRPAKGY
jgi:hypothetical protein